MKWFVDSQTYKCTSIGTIIVSMVGHNTIKLGHRSRDPGPLQKVHLYVAKSVLKYV